MAEVAVQETVVAEQDEQTGLKQGNGHKPVGFFKAGNTYALGKGRPRGSRDFAGEFVRAWKAVEKRKGVKVMERAIEQALDYPKAMNGILRKVLPDLQDIRSVNVNANVHHTTVELSLKPEELARVITAHLASRVPESTA